MRKDIILVHYNIDPIGFFIRFFTKSEWNHCAFILDSNFIIESNRHGIIVSNINKFNNKWLYKTKYLKVPKLKKKDKKDLIFYMLCLNTSKQCFIHRIWSYFLILCHYSGHIYPKTCSSLLSHAFALKNIYFNQKRLDFITPEDIYKSQEVIKDV